MALEINSTSYYIVLALIINLVALFVYSCRYILILAFLKEKMTLIKSFNITMVTQFTKYFSPFSMSFTIGKPILTKFVSNIKIRTSFVAVFFENLYELIFHIVLLLVLIVLLGQEILFESALPKVIIGIGIFLSIIILILNHKKVIALIVKLRFLLPKKVRKAIIKANLGKDGLNSIFDESTNLLTNKRLVLNITIVNLVALFIMPLAFKFVTMVYIPTFPYKLSIIIYWISFILGRLSLIPGGLGSREASMIALFTFLGVDAVTATKITVLQRIIAASPHFAIGGPLSFYYGMKYGSNRLKNKNSHSKTQNYFPTNSS